MPNAGMRRLAWTIWVLILAASAASAQMPYGISPLRLEIQVRPGGVGEGKIKIHSLSGTEPLRMPFEIRSIMQSRQGLVRLAEEGDLVPRPCVDWLKASPEAVDLRPREIREVTVRVVAPRSARGTYCAALVTNPEPRKTKPAQVAEGSDVVVGMVFRVAVVVDITVIGPTPTQSCQLTGATLTHVTTGEGVQARESTAAVVTARNAGETAMRVRPRITVSSDKSGRPVRIWSGTSEPVRIYPEAERDITVDTGRLWPGGKYDIRVMLEAEGSRVADEETTVELPQPTGGTVAQLGDIPLQITPQFSQLDVRPGMSRTMLVNVANLADVAARLRVQPLMPNEIKTLINRSGGEVPSFSCDEWLEVQPAEFELAPGRSRKVRILARVPQDATGSYYARLLFQATDPSDTIHVQAETLAWVATPGQVTRQAELGPLQVAAVGGSKYTAKVTLSNTGNIHFEPKASVAVLGIMGGALAATPMTSDKPLVLRSAETTLAGELDLKSLDNGDYDLKCVVTLGEKEVLSTAAVLRVSWDRGQQQVSLVAPKADGGAEPGPAPSPEATTASAPPLAAVDGNP